MELRINISDWKRPDAWGITTFMTREDPEAHTPSRVDSANPNWEQACIVQLEHGNPDGFNELVQHYSSRIYSHLFRMVGSREEAEDLTQETFILAYRKIKTYDHARPFRNWLYTIATNVGRNAYRSRGRRIPSAKIDQGTEVIVSNNRDSTIPESHELKDRLASVVNRLPEPLPMLIQLYYQEGTTIREAAEVLGMSESAAKVALHRARKTLRTMLEKDET